MDGVWLSLMIGNRYEVDLSVELRLCTLCLACLLRIRPAPFTKKNEKRTTAGCSLDYRRLLLLQFT